MKTFYMVHFVFKPFYCNLNILIFVNEENELRIVGIRGSVGFRVNKDSWPYF